MGLANVLSHTVSTPRARHSAATARRSASFSIGLVGVSIQTSLVSGRSARSSAPGSARSAYVKSSPALWRRTRSNRR